MSRRKPVVCFVILTYLVTWPIQIASLLLADSAGTSLNNEANYQHLVDLLTGDLAADQLLAFGLFNIGQFGPLIAAVVLTAGLYGAVGLRDLRARMVRWRLPAHWYLIVLALPVALSLATLTITFVMSGLKVGPFAPELAWVSFLPFLLYMLVFTGLAEEPGWRGFALPHLQANHSAANSSWILGFIWGIWHVPFTIYFNLANPVLIIPSLLGLTFGIVGWTMVNTWIYNSTGSVLLLTLLHGWGNAVQSYLVLSQPNFLALILYAVLPWAIAIYLSKRYGDENLAAVPRARQIAWQA